MIGVAMKKKVSAELKKERNDKIKRFLKDMIAPTIFVIIVVFVLYKMATYQKPVDENDIPTPYSFDGDTTPVVLENSNFKFELDAETTQFTVTDKRNGNVWLSNPDISTDSIALTDAKEKLQSTFVLTYSQESGLETTYSSFTKSIQNQVYEIVRGNDYVTIKYSLGDVAKKYMIPPIALAADFEEYIAQIEAADSKKSAQDTKSRYKKYDINNLSATDQEKVEELKELYPIIETEVVYILRDGLKDNQKSKLQKAFATINYSQEQLDKDSALNETEEVQENPVFNFEVTYKLTDKGFEVSVPMDSFQNPSAFPIYKFNVLPFFGAGSKTEEGFLFVPEGGGAIINFNNGKLTTQSYSSRVYGWDLCLVRDSIVHDPFTNFGVFGISKGDSSFICIPKDGASYCTISADISGRYNSFNYVNTTYDIYQREQYDVGNISSNDIFKYIDKLPEGENLTQEYILLDSGSYVDMAKAYQSYIKDNYGSYMKMNNDSSTPVNVEIIGAVDKTEQIVGIPVSKPLELTTFEEAEGIANELYDEVGMRNVNFKLTGWCNGGVNQSILSGISVLSKLGGKSDLKDLSAALSDKGYTLSLNGITMLALDSNIFDGFFSYTDAAKNISKERMELHKYSAVTYALREGTETFYLLHTDLTLEYADNLVEAAGDYNAGVSFDDIGRDIASDFYKSDYHSRESVRKLQIEYMKKYKDQGKYIVINNGNDFVVPYVDMVTNMDLAGSNYSIIDHNIPFFELVRGAAALLDSGIGYCLVHY